jgi:hypothetical protein
VENSQPPTDPETVKDDTDARVIEDLILAMVIADLEDRRAALQGAMPDTLRRHLISQQVAEVLEILIHRHRHSLGLAEPRKVIR